MTGLPTAYCAPGRKAVSALILALKDEQAADIIETRMIEGADVYLIRPQAAALHGPDMTFEPAPRSRLEALARLHHWPAAQSPMVLSAVI